ncbi:tyrosine-type recombinase/integrase [Cryobacterium sp. GrIS_2_6]|uniref:tyrosine-type recombinase/integrase n=1 Tax=Cryobacterium sp. GrIS_2_6 TaxID=3162785 RepID=UPI002E0C7ABB|nr:tyrosine-type recombinase/integrase [Cryobacterium psychrotolerans]MEC5150742.1 integrase [Cryobacterium psychrotolerans]
MGSITAYQVASGKRYRVLYRRPDHIQTQKRGFRTKRDAELFLANIEVNKSRGAYVDPSKARVLVGEWLDLWMDSRSDWRATSRERARGIVVRHIRPQLGNYPLGALNHQAVQAWASGLSRTQGPASVRKIVNVLSGSLQMAVKDGRLASNPAHGLNLPKVHKASKRYLTHEQVRDLSAAVDAIGRGMYLGQSNGYGLLVKVLAYCGLRWGEASGLRVQDIDFVRGRLEVQHTVVEIDGLQIEGQPKDYEARSIPVPASILADLRVLVSGRQGGDPVFAAARGGWLRGRVFRRGWLDAAAEQVGIAGLAPHELRHTAASLAISAGANVKAVQRMLGHASAAVTLDVYSDLFDSDLDAVSSALDQLIIQKSIASLNTEVIGDPRQPPETEF